MSKTTLRKAISDFEAPELRELLIDIYTKSKEAKELLDFFAAPDIEKKTEDYRNILDKEITRVKHRYPSPRMAKLRAAIKKFTLFEPGTDAVAELMVHTLTKLICLGKTGWLPERLYGQIEKFATETRDFLIANQLLDDYLPRIRKHTSEIKNIRSMRNPLSTIMQPFSA